MKIGPYRIVDIVNPKKWFAVADAKVAQRYLSLAYAEQVVYRSVHCRPCVEAGSCLHCGCESPANMLAATNSCSNGNWGPMWSEQQWAEFKKSYGLQFNVTLNPSQQ